jgi:hypothetical protein
MNARSKRRGGRIRRRNRGRPGSKLASPAKFGQLIRAAVRGKRKPRARRVGASPGMGKAAGDWLRLLADPCTGELCRPCYTGADSGYLVRTLDYQQVTGVCAGTPGAIIPAQGIAQFTPFNWSTTSGARLNGTPSGGAGVALVETGFTNFITTNSGSVRRYRPVAACLKWVPTGPYASRSGVVGWAYTTGTTYSAGAIVAANAALSLVQHSSPNGSEAHECRWMPTQIDETWTQTAVADSESAGTVTLVLFGTDATVQSSGTSFNMNGYIEITVVWEWLPQDTGSAGSSGITAAARAPLPFTSQQVLSQVKDMGAFLFRGAVAAGAGVVRGAVEDFVYGVDRGVGQSRYIGGGMGA